MTTTAISTKKTWASVAVMVVVEIQAVAVAWVKGVVLEALDVIPVIVKYNLGE